MHCPVLPAPWPSSAPGLRWSIDFWLSVCSTGCGFAALTDAEWKTRARPETRPGLLSPEAASRVEGCREGMGGLRSQAHSTISGKLVKGSDPAKHKAAQSSACDSHLLLLLPTDTGLALNSGLWGLIVSELCSLSILYAPWKQHPPLIVQVQPWCVFLPFHMIPAHPTYGI